MSDKWLCYTLHGVGCRLVYLERTRLTATTADEQVQFDCKNTEIYCEKIKNNRKCQYKYANLSHNDTILLNTNNNTLSDAI